MQDTYNELQEKREKLTDLIHYLRVNNKKLAKAERDYRMELSKTILQLNTEGYKGEIDGKEYDTSNVAWTSTWNLARGLPEVAELRYERDIAEGEREATMQKIYQVKKDIDHLMEEMKAIRKGE